MGYSQDFCDVFLVWEVMMSSQGWFFYGPSISFKLKNLLVNFPSVFGLCDVLILVMVSFIDNSIYRGFLLLFCGAFIFF